MGKAKMIPPWKKEKTVMLRTVLTRSLVIVVMLAVGALGFARAACADEGMWTYNNFPKHLVEQRYGLSPSDAWLEHLRLSSVRFNNGGSGAFVSPEGLVITNHHVGSDCIQELSSSAHDYMAEGFYAPAREKEAKCPNLELNQLVSIEEVTAAVNAGLRPEMDAAARNDAQRAAIAHFEKECSERTRLRCDVVTLYEGGVFSLYRYRKYTDVRLVFAPEADIAAFGGDPDNFTYPRYDLDIAFLRVYEDGRPLRAEHYLAWNPRGISEGAPVFVSGHPGTTSRQSTMAQLEFYRDVRIPFILRLLEARLKFLHEFTGRGAEPARIARDAVLTYENSFKVYTWQLAGLRDPAFLARRTAVEKSLRGAVAADPKLEQAYDGAWVAIAAAQRTFASIYCEYRLLDWALRQSDLFRYARHLVRLPAEQAKPNGQRLEVYRDSRLESLKQDLLSAAPVYDALEALLLAQAFAELREVLGPSDPDVQRILAGLSPAEAAEAYVKGSKLQSAAERKRLIEGGQKAIEASTDTMLALAKMVDARSRAVLGRYEDQVLAVERANGTLLAKALFAVAGKDTYPEATFTLRLSVGAVKGYVDEGRPRRSYTTFHGLYENSVGIPPYKLPQRWLDKQSAIHFDTPFNFVCTPDITGGNSGSPVVNRNGEFVGIIFDGNLQQIPSDFLYTEEQARAIAVHAAGILEALRQVYGAEAIVRELRIAGAN